MARRVSWTNNSSGHLGTYVYRAPTLDPLNLPAPVATVGPVAQGAMAEWIDDSGAYECYAVQDFDGSGVSVLSGEVCVTDPFANAQIGDEIGGGVYAGINTIGGVDYHIICGVSASETSGLAWKTSQTGTAGTASESDGLANTQSMVAAGIADHPAAQHCVNYAGGGYSDWHMPALDQLILIYNNLSTHPELSDNNASGDYTMASTESSNRQSWGVSLSTGTALDGFYKDFTGNRVRPIRRVLA